MHNEGLCKVCRDRLILYFYRELDVIETAILREHLGSCKHCKAEYDEFVVGLQAVIFALKNDGMDIENIAAVFGISPGAVKSHLVRAVEVLKKVMKES